MLGENKFLAGHLVGIGKIKKTGEVEYQKLEKPIHNRIVSGGLDHLLVMAGPDKSSYFNTVSGSVTSYCCFLWVDGYAYKTTNGYRRGAVHYARYGSSTQATSFTDTDLVSPTVAHYATKYSNTTAGQQLNGTWINSFGNYTFRVTHQSPAAESATTVNEIAWYGGYGPASTETTKVMFARVVLPSPITLAAGEYLLTTYEITETNSNASVTYGNNFFNLLDSNGNPLQYAQRIVRQHSSSTAGNSNIGEPRITNTGVATTDAYIQRGYQTAFEFYQNSNVSNFSYSASSSKDFPAEGAAESTTAFSASTGYSATIQPYTGAGTNDKHRDITYVSGAYNPGMANNIDGYTDIYYLNFNGMAYKFGYMDNGVWVPQALRKYANKNLTFTFRTRYSTEDTL